MAMQRWDLHRRIALRTIKTIGTSPSRIVLGFMVATAYLSMWVSNTATVMMMMTQIGLAVVYQCADLVEERGADVPVERGEFHFGTGLMLSIAYAASIGGVGTLIDTPPNAVVFGSGYITMPQMVRAGFWLNLVGIGLIIALSLAWLPFAWGIDITQLPQWAT